MGSGVAWIDFDLDGCLDLYLANGCPLREKASDYPEARHFNQLFQNCDTERFRNVTINANVGDDGYGQGIAVGDFDADGFPDLFVANYGANRMLRNNGDGTFDDVTQQTGVGNDRWATSTIFLDLNRDSLLDLYVVNYLDVTFANYKICVYNEKPGYCGPGDYEGVQDLAYINQGDGTFIESADKLGLTESDGKGLAVAALDFNDDLQPEVYVANDMSPNFFFSQNKSTASTGKPLFHNVAVAAGCAMSDDGEYEASMGVSCADFDRDGRPDIFLSHFHAAKNTLYHNLGNLTFSDNSRRSRIAATSFDMTGFGTLPFDYDRDGFMDLFIANGHVLGPEQTPNKMQPQLLHNNGAGRFIDVSNDAGQYFREVMLGRAVAGGDYDNDGDLDIAVTHLDRPPVLLRNDTESGRHFIGMCLKSRDRIPPVGGRVVIANVKSPLVIPIQRGGSYLASPDSRIVIGLGTEVEPVDVDIYWPSGHVDHIKGLQVDRYWRIVEGLPPEPV